MKAFLYIAALCLLIAATLATPTPSGTYCGSYSFGLVKGKVTFGPSTFDISFDGMGAHVHCPAVAYQFHADTNLVEVPSAADKSDCLGSVLVDNDLSLKVKFNPAEDSTLIDLGLASLTAHRC